MTSGSSAEPGDLTLLVVPTEVGSVVAVMGPRGLVWVGIDDRPDDVAVRVSAMFGGAPVLRDDTAHPGVAAALAAIARGEHPTVMPAVDLHGTPFQVSVWRQLQQIPRGEVMSYAEVAAAVGRPSAVRAAAGACAANPVGLVVPCHRVVRSDGSLGGFGWGVATKRRLLELEGVRLEGARLATVGA